MQLLLLRGGVSLLTGIAHYTDIILSPTDRVRYLMTLDPNEASLRSVHVFVDVLKMYSDKAILREYPLHMEFEGEMAVDQGGVTRDMYSAFWEECYSTVFDGSTLLVPMLSPQTDVTVLPVVGSIISHGYLVSGFLPVRCDGVACCWKHYITWLPGQWLPTS